MTWEVTLFFLGVYKIKEDAIIQRLQDEFPQFIGDDAAIFPKTKDQHYVVSKDLLVEGTHFRTSYFSPEDLAHKALHVNLSDLAAMGATPLYMLCGLSIPEKLGNYAQEMLMHLVKQCKELNLHLIGGDTTRSLDHLFVSITAIGEAKAGQIKCRTTARPGDLIYIAGPLGWANAGLKALEEKFSVKQDYIQHFLRPHAKIKEGVWLGKQSSVTSMMDLSDGLFMDLTRLCAASKVAAQLDVDAIESGLSEGISLTMALEGGEDYALLLTLASKRAESIAKAFEKAFAYPLQCIGHITEGSGLLFEKKGEPIGLTVRPFSHF